MEGSQTDLEHHDLKNDMVVTSLEFLFIPDLGFKKPVIWEFQWVQTKIPKKNLLSLAKEPEKEQLSKT